MEAVFAVTFSGMVTLGRPEIRADRDRVCLMSYLIAIGVVVILGAVTGLVRQARQQTATK
jgi:hypothetical protein